MNRASSYHEAGHAIVAHILGKEVNIINFAGEPHVWMTGGKPGEAHIVVLYAGREAHLRYAPDEVKEAEEGAYHDLAEINELLTTLRITHESRGALRAQAQEHVRACWEWIDRLVEEVNKRGGLVYGYPTVSNLLEEITGIPAPWVVDEAEDGETT